MVARQPQTQRHEAACGVPWLVLGGTARDEHMTGRSIQLELDLEFAAARPMMVTSIVPTRRRGRLAIGWHGIREAMIQIDQLLVSELLLEGYDAQKVFIEPRSPARKADLRTGDYVVSISTSPVADMSLAKFDALGLPAGTEVFVKFVRPGRATRVIRTTIIRLRRQPGPPRPRWWQRGPRVAYYQGPKGICPSYSRLARDVGCSRRWVMDHIKLLWWLGALEIIQGAGLRGFGGYTNQYVFHWPEGWGANVVSFTASANQPRR